LNRAVYLVSITVGPRSEQLNHISDALRAMIGDKRDAIKDDYGIGLGTFSTSVVTLDFARHGDDTVY